MLKWIYHYKSFTGIENTVEFEQHYEAVKKSTRNADHYNEWIKNYGRAVKTQLHENDVETWKVEVPGEDKWVVITVKEEM